jgi:predicted dinucleotide-binding enzyme
MKIGVLGTGMVGSAIAGKLKALGHDVMVGSRDPGGEKAKALGLPAGSYAEAAAHGDWVVNALPGEPAAGYLGQCQLDDKIVLDISNYDHAVDEPIETPVGEVIQRAFPKARVVKALNSVSAHLMVDPQQLGKPHTVFVAGNDAAAKGEVTELLRSFGWKDIIDLGDVSAFRAMEQLIPLWMALERVTGGPEFQLAVVRGWLLGRDGGRVGAR